MKAKQLERTLGKQMNFRFSRYIAKTLFTTAIASTAVHGQVAGWQSDIVSYGADDRLEYVRDAEGNMIPDFSYAGYRNGEAIPSVPTVKVIDPIAGDNTAHIDSALFEVSMLPLDSDGFHGALLLRAGEYEIRGTINVGYDGVVLRGVGDGQDPTQNTVLFATGTSQRTVVVLGGGSTSGWSFINNGTKSDIVSDTVLVGERKFRVENPLLYSVGDNIIIYHPCTAEWLEAVDYGGTHSDHAEAEPGIDVPWTVNSQPIVFNRYITAINDDTITVDAPLYNTLIRALAQSYIYRYTRSGLKTNIGIEDLRIEIDAAHDTDENHAWDAIDMFQIEDAWALRCTMLRFGMSGIQTGTASRITVEDCQALDPASIIEGGKRYNFNVYHYSQLILFKNCRASNGRHHYVSNGTSTTSGIVFVDCTSEGAYTSSEGHRRWTQGMLYDNHTELDGPRAGLNPRLLGLYNRGYYGTSHGWALVNSIAWNCDVAAGDLIVQKPPTGQNYAIGCSGAHITGVRPPAAMDDPEGYIEGANLPGLEPRSLYNAQFQDRTGVPPPPPPPPPVALVDIDHQLPWKIQLYQNYPNPFNPVTTLRFDLPAKAVFTLKVYDLAGREVRQLVHGEFQDGTHEYSWDGRNSQGAALASGLYIARLSGDQQVISRKMLLLK
ncbi:FlgD immunoglobulin-like domain containing protein [Candidatus Neomarinimicrobiota bacterium]